MCDLRALGVLCILLVACLSQKNETVDPLVRPSMGPLLKLSLKKYPYARCLDGTPGAYYYLPGDPKIFVIHLHGGSHCASEWSCRLRTFNEFGSSLWLLPLQDFRSPGRFTDTDEDRNKYFAMASMVSIPYCSGDAFLGQNTKATVETFNFWMSGHHIVDAVFKELLAKRNMANADLIVLSGWSAGASGAFLHLDYLSDTMRSVNSSAHVVGAPFAGFQHMKSPPYSGPDVTPYIRLDDEELIRLAQMWKAFLPKRCVAQHSGDAHQCGVPAIAAESIETPVMFISTQTDSVNMGLHFGIGRSPPFHGEMKEYVALHADVQRQEFAKLIRQGVAAFNPACWTHTYFDGIRVQGYTYQEAFHFFLQTPLKPFYLVDNCGIDCNPTCPPRKQSDEYNIDLLR